MPDPCVLTSAERPESLCSLAHLVLQGLRVSLLLRVRPNICEGSSMLSTACLQVRVLVILIRSQEKKEERRERKRR